MSLFGTNGIRGILNETLDPELAYKLGMAAGTYFEESEIAIANDSRTSSDLLKQMVAAGIMNAGKNVIDLGLFPTPGLQVYCKTHAIPGVMITASHNPPEFNGLKLVRPDGLHPNKEQESEVERIITGDLYYKTTWDTVGRIRSEDASEIYIARIHKFIKVAKIRMSRLNVLADLANSVATKTTPALLRSIGVKYTSINGNPDGFFPGRNPEPTEENLQKTINFAKSGGFDLTVAHDGDADRAVFLDENGNFIDGDKVVAIIADHILQSKKGDLVIPVSSSFLIDWVAKNHGVKVHRTKVGAPIVADELEKINGLFGGEENGGVIYPEYLNARDGAFALAMMLDIIASEEQSISKIVEKMPDYKIKRIRIPMNRDFDSIKKELLNKYQDFDKDETDGIKLIKGDKFILARKSGTEPIIRIYISAIDEDWISTRENEIRKII